MPRRIFIALFACGFVCAAPAARASEVSHARIVRLSYAQGDVQLSADGASGWQKAIANTPLREGMALATGDGRAEVEFESGLTAWMASNTVVEFPQLVLEDGAKISRLNVTQGTATFYVKPGRGDFLVVQAGQLLLRAPESARFRVDVFGDGSSVSVLRGGVDAEVHGAAQRVSSHKTLAFRNDASPDITLTANPSADGWDRWVSDRENAVERAQSDSSYYMREPYGYGLADLSFYGGWVNMPGYGYGWQPYGVGAGWSPFFNGYWSGYGAFGPAWISYEPWGWMPYHYGGWVFSPLLGWVWLPGNFGAWSPGTVAWVRTPKGALGWVPRGPREAATATPASLSRGVITNTGAGTLARSRNSILPVGETSGVRVVGEWKNDAELVRFSQQSQATAQTSGHGAPPSVHAAQRMPAGSAPRIASAGTLSGRVQTYHPPAGGYGSGHGAGYGGASGSARSSSSAGSAPSSSSAARTGAASTGSGGSRGKP